MEVVVARDDELVCGQMLAVKVHDLALVLVREEDGTISALEDRCTHARVRLSRGKLMKGSIFCVAHGARFDTKTGQPLCFPATRPVRCFRARSVDGNILIELPGPPKS